MDTQVNLVVSLWLLLLHHVGFVLVVNEVDDGCPRVAVVDIVSEAGAVNHGEFSLELLFLKLGLDDFDLSQLVELFVVATAVVLWGRQLGGEKCVDKRSLAQPRLA